MPQCINKDYINVKMKLKGLKYASISFDIYYQDHEWTTYSRGFQKVSRCLLKLLTKNIDPSLQRVEIWNLCGTIQLQILFSSCKQRVGWGELRYV